MRSEIRNHLVYNWWKYILLAIIPIVAWVYIFGAINKPKPNETINITFVGSTLKNEALKTDIEGWLPEISVEQTIKEVGVECLYVEDSYTLNSILAIRVTDKTDFVIMQESDLTDFDLSAYFVSLSETVVTENFGSATTYSVDNTIYGICLNDDENVFSNYYVGTERCYLFITGVSENFGGINGKGQEKDRSCINLINSLLEVN